MGLETIFHQLQMAPAAYLATKLWREGGHREYRAFWYYVVVCLVKSPLLFALAASNRWEEYSRLYWLTHALVGGLMLCVAGELAFEAYGKRWMERAAQILGMLALIVFWLWPSVPLDRGIRVFTCVALAVTLPMSGKMDLWFRTRLTGCFALCFVPALLEGLIVIGVPSPAQYVTTGIYLLALTAWIYAFRQITPQAE